MSSTANSWTLASKKGKVASSPKGKKQKPFTETMPRIEQNAPMEETPTIYSVFRQEEERLERKEQKILEKEKAAASYKQSSSVPAVTNSAVPKKNQMVAKKAPEKKKVPTLEEIMAEITVPEMQAVLDKDKVTFPDNPDVWLKDLASLLNLKLDKLPVGDPTYSNKPTDYPACLLSKQVKSFLLQTLSRASTQTLRMFLDHCIDTMMSDITKAIPSYGFHIFVQLLLLKAPHIGINSMPAYLALLKDNINRPQRALCILWTIGQAGLSDLGNGLKVWIDLMLPVLNMRNLSTYAVQYLESLFKLHPSLKLGANASAFPKREFFMLFDELFSTQPNLSTDLHARMMKMYPNIKAIAFGIQPETTLHNFFTSFLSRCSADSSGKKRAELLECLVTCLHVDKQSFSTWRQIYVKHLPQSSILLQYLLNKLDSKRLEMDLRLLRETIRSFSVTNDDLTATSATSLPPDFGRCVSTCSELLTRLTRVGFPAHWFLTLVIVVVSLALGFDVYNNGGVTRCWTYRTLLAAGILDIIQQAWRRLCLYTSTAWLWLADNVPSYFSMISDITFPYITLFLAKLSEAFTYVLVTLQPYYRSVLNHAEQFITRLNAKLPLVLNLLCQYIDWFLQTLVIVTLSMYRYIQICSDWIVTNVLIGSWSPDNIARIVTGIVTSVHSSALTLWHSIFN